ncbi:MAG: hypothetical protein JWQ02_3434 [Capsulimonas sp.]|jgi:thiol-disulfide isomerase/thioredoxin/outer membrane lipoprotein-sorting protein|nr:hypothetical protein [Capsulimonas sp.]
MINRYLAGALALLPLILVSPSHADTVSLPKIDPKALALLTDVEKSVEKTKSMSADFTLIRHSVTDNEDTCRVGVFRFLRPNYCYTEAWTNTRDAVSGKWKRDAMPPTYRVSDGKSQWLVDNDGSYIDVGAPKQGAGLAQEFNPNAPLFEAPDSETKQFADQQKKHRLIALTYAGMQRWDGQDYQVIDWSYKVDAGISHAAKNLAPGGIAICHTHLFIGADHLVHRFTYDWNTGMSGEGNVKHLRANVPMTASSFKFTLPKYAHAPGSEQVGLVGTAAPDFTATKPDGSNVKLSEFKGQVIVIDFWATWCGPCQAEMPHLQRVYDQVKDKDVVVLAVCVSDTKEAYAKWVSAKSGVYTFPTAFDQGWGTKQSIGALYKVKNIPTQFVIDKDGKIAAGFIGLDAEGSHPLAEALAKLGVDVSTPPDKKP